MLSQEQTKEFQNRLDKLDINDQYAHLELHRYGHIIMDGNYSSEELKEISSIMHEVELAHRHN